MENMGNGSRHCSTCNKCVTNFQKLSPQQLQAEIDKQGGNVCGVYKLDQLDNIHQRFFVKNYKSIVVSVIGLLGLFSSAISANGQTQPQAIPSTTPQNNSTQIADTLNASITISGKLRDNASLAVAAGAKIQVMQNGQVIKTVTTNSKGLFYFHLKKNELTDSLITLQVMYEFPSKQYSKPFVVVNDEHLANAYFDLQLRGIPTLYLLYDEDELVTPRRRSGQFNILGRCSSVISEEYNFTGGTIRWRID